MKRTLCSALAVTTALASMTSCSKNNDKFSYSVPATYSFDNVEYKEASGRISMWFAYTSMLGKSSTRKLNQDTINNLWNNVNNSFTAEVAANIPYSPDSLNKIGFSLASKATDAVTFKALADSTVKVSQYYNTPASKGVAGKYESRLVNYKGLEFNQAVAKGLMGALSLYNVISILDKIPSDDNNTVTAGKGTVMQHNWDLAFGYVGVPKDYDTAFSYTATPVKADRPFALGGYFAERGKPIAAGGRVFEAFRKGRAAIVAKDYATRDAAILTIKEYMEKTIAAAAYYYISIQPTRAKISEKVHDLSEAYGFILALKYRASNSKLSATNYQALLDIMSSNFYEIMDDATNAKTKQAQSILTTVYGQLQ